MSEQQRIGFGNRKLWVGGAVTVLAVGVAMIAFDIPPKSENVTGTIAPAERYRAPQDATAPVKLGDQTMAQLMQNDGFDKLIKDPQMKALSQDASIRMLAQVLAKSPEAARAILLNVDASRAAAENVALAQAILANVDASRAALEAAQADRSLSGAAQEAALVAAMAAQAQRTPSAEVRDAGLVAAQRAELASMMAGKLEASKLIMERVEASRATVEHVAVAQAVLANLQASRLLVESQANQAALSSAEAGLMVQRAEASRLQLEKATTNRATQ